jgi:PAS domain S-box-containing protein/putative nucleotidyltransferase with HDIG domain
MGKHASFDREYKIIRQNDKAERWLHGLGALEIDEQGRLLNMHGVIQDVTERKQAEQLLRDREREYRTLVEQIPAIVYVDDVSGEIHSLYIGPQVEKILGYTPQEWLEQSLSLWISLLHPDDREVVRAKYMRCVEKGEPFEAEYRIRTADGRLLWLHDQAVMLRDENGNPQLIHGVMQDTTAHKQAEDEMRQRVLELEMLYESGLAINQPLDPKEIGEKMIELLEQKLGWHHTTVRLYHPQDESLELLAFNQPGLRTEDERHEVAERFSSLVANSTQGLSGWSVRHKQVVRSNDLPNDSRYVDTYPGLRSGLYVPMLIGDRAVGVISIESEQSDAFNSADERLAATLANQAASALENARLFEAERKQRQVSDALRDALRAGASMSASLDFETILDHLLDALERIVPFEDGSILFIQSGKSSIARMRGYKKLGKNAIQAILKRNLDVSSLENLRWMTENKQPLVIPDVNLYPGWIRYPETSYIRSWAGAPIIINGEVIAYFSLDSAEPNFFSRDDRELMRAFTGQASLALQNARLFEQTERRFQEFAALYETSRILSSENDLNAMLQVIVEHAKKLLNASSSGIYLYLVESDELILTVDTTPYLIIGTRLRLGEGAAGYVAKTRQPLRLDDYSTWEGRSSQYDDKLIHAILEIPMLYGGELIGVLTADETGDSERKFTEADEHLLSLFASQAAGAIHSARLREQTERQLRQLQALHLIDRAISSSFDLRPILNTVIDQTITQLNVDAVDVLLYHPHLQLLDYVAGRGFRTRAIEQTRLRLGECFSGRAAFDRRTLHVTSLPEAGSSFTRSEILQAEEFLELYSVPLIAKGQVKGILEVFNRTELPTHSDWLDFLETLAGQAAITIDQTQLFEDLQRANLELVIAYDATIEGWARAMDLRDKETESHTERVTELTVSLARVLGVKNGDLVHIRRGALLHDIGKMGVPDNILLKEGELTEAEWSFMRQHPQFAYEMLRPIKYLRQSLDIPYCHHEKWDGTGYPRGLRGEQIPIAARIFAIVDVWDAITSDRPYRKAWTKRQALAHIREQSGKQFDPKIVEMFLEIFEREDENSS